MSTASGGPVDRSWPDLIGARCWALKGADHRQCINCHIHWEIGHFDHRQT